MYYIQRGEEKNSNFSAESLFTSFKRNLCVPSFPVTTVFPVYVTIMFQAFKFTVFQHKEKSPSTSMSTQDQGKHLNNYIRNCKHATT